MLEVCFADNNTWYILILVQTEQRLTLQTVMKQTVTVQVPSVSSIIYIDYLCVDVLHTRRSLKYQYPDHINFT